MIKGKMKWELMINEQCSADENFNEEIEAKCEEANEGQVASQDATRKSCWQCLNYGKYKCVGCRKARYCSEECQLENWAGHKEYCLAKMNRIAFKEFRYLSASIFE